MEIEVIEPDCYYHIYNRGINRQPIFLDQGHYLKFLSLCKKYLPSYADILAYCLIPNHFHFLVYILPEMKNLSEIPRRGIKNPLGNLFNSYAQWFNNGTERVGGLFQRPFKRKRITTQEYLRQVLYYIHRNPVHHGLVENLAEYEFSSFKTLIGNKATFLNRKHTLDFFDDQGHFEEYHRMKFEVENSDLFDDF